MNEQEKKRIKEILGDYSDALRNISKGASDIRRERYEFAAIVVECIAKDSRMYGDDELKP